MSLGLQLVMEGRVLGPYHRQQEESSQGGLHDAGHDASQPRRKAQAGATRLSLRAAAAQPQVSTDWKERKGMNPVGLAAEEGQPPRCSKASKGNPLPPPASAPLSVLFFILLPHKHLPSTYSVPGTGDIAGTTLAQASIRPLRE